MNDLPVDKMCECPPGCSSTYFSINVFLALVPISIFFPPRLPKYCQSATAAVHLKNNQVGMTTEMPFISI